MIVAVDTSALGKLMVEETESGAVRDFLASRQRSGDEFAISTIAVTELRRLSIRADIDPENVERILRPFRVIGLTEGTLQLAGRLPYRQLGTLDAIHIAAALTIGAAALLTFDARQADAAALEGLTIECPH